MPVSFSLVAFVALKLRNKSEQANKTNKLF